MATGKLVGDEVLDNAFLLVQNDCDRIYVCRNQPTSYIQASSLVGSGGEALHGDSVNNSMTGIDFTIGEGDGPGNGRKMTVAQKADIGITVTENANHVALTDSVNTRLHYVTTLSGGPVAVTSGNDITVNSWQIQIDDPI